MCCHNDIYTVFGKVKRRSAQKMPEAYCGLEHEKLQAESPAKHQQKRHVSGLPQAFLYLTGGRVNIQADASFEHRQEFFPHQGTTPAFQQWSAAMRSQLPVAIGRYQTLQVSTLGDIRGG
jgi:hypothetical protein